MCKDELPKSSPWHSEKPNKDLFKLNKHLLSNYIFLVGDALNVKIDSSRIFANHCKAEDSRRVLQ